MSKFKWSEINKPAFILAPMANITTLPFRSICKEMGADIVFTPMLSSDAIVFNPKETLKIAEFLPEEQPVIVQLFGYDGEIIAKAANIVQKKLKPAGIDINMGCPAPKITGNECGSALLRDYDKALLLIKHVRENFDGQLSVKIRLGWRDKDVLAFAKKLEEIGIDALSIHGRTTKQGYSGEADWEPIYEIADSLSIPVFGNGDIVDFQGAYDRLLDSNLSGVMVGRGALGNPWIFRDIKEKKHLEISCAEKAEILYRQAEVSVEYYGEKIGVLEMRKHMGWYIKSFPGALELRKFAMQAEKLSDIEQVVSKLKNLE